MDKNTIIGFVLIAAVLIGFSYWSRPSEAEIEAMHRQDSIEAVAMQRAKADQKAKEEAEIAAAVRAAQDTTSLFYAHRSGEAKTVVMENELVRLTFNTRGGTVQKAELKEYKNQQGGMVTLGMVLAAAGVPMEGVSLVAGLIAIIGMGSTANNVGGDMAAAILVDKRK